MTMLEQFAVPLLCLALVVGCAWAYPRLNGWVYRRRRARDLAAAERADGREVAAPRRAS